MSALIEPASFFASMRRLTGPLSGAQVAVVNALLSRAAHWPVSWVAYAIATAWHETGGKMVPNVESLNYSVEGLLGTFGRHRISEADARRLGRKPGEGPLSTDRQRQIGNLIYGGAWGRKQLGNVKLDDGWDYRGRGMDHCTGRTNYGTTGAAIGVDLLGEPDALLSPRHAVAALVTGMETGRYTGERLADFLPAHIGTRGQFTAARAIINGSDKAFRIAAHALAFQDALIAGDWA